SGTRVKVALVEPTDENGIRDALTEVGVRDDGIQRVTDPELGDNVFQFQAAEMSPKEVAAFEDLLERNYGIAADAFDVTTVGPTFGAQVARSAVLAVIFS